jgi:uncharacterized protein YegP (UPF0339 family)
MAGKFVLKTSKDGQTYFVLQAGNGQTILQSETYASRSSASAGIDSVRQNASIPERYERTATAGGQFRFNLKAANGQVIGTSESYQSESARDAGIESVGKNAPDAAVVDET